MTKDEAYMEGIANLHANYGKQLFELSKRIAELEADKVNLTKDLADKQEQLDILAHKALDLEAENKRLLDFAKDVASYTGVRYDAEEKERLRSELLKTAMSFLLKPEPPKEQP